MQSNQPSLLSNNLVEALWKVRGLPQRNSDMLSLRNPSGNTPYHPRPRPPSHRMPPGQLPLKARDQCVMQTVICYLYAQWMFTVRELVWTAFRSSFLTFDTRQSVHNLSLGHTGDLSLAWTPDTSILSSIWIQLGMWDYARWIDEEECQINRQTAEIPITFYVLQKVWWILPWAGKTPCEIIMSCRLRLKALLSQAQMLGRFK